MLAIHSVDRRPPQRATAGVRYFAAALAVALIAGGGCSRTELVAPHEPVDRIVVHKAARQLLLLRGREVERSYHVALGLNPVGPKEREGDFRTPEGTYYLERTAHSDYFLSLKVSYPNRADLERARAAHLDPGGLIMIHGLPNHLKHAPAYYATHDWTDGCIAVSNADMAEIWPLVRDGVPIDILPR